MIVFQDIITGDELFTDAFKYTIKDDFFYEVEGKIVTEDRGAGDVNIGGNPSAEGGDEDGGTDDSGNKVSGCNIVLASKLSPTQFDKKSYQVYIKDYMKALKAKIAETRGQEAADNFVKKAQTSVKEILGNFKNYDFYLGESQNPDGQVALLDYREDGVTPYMLFFKDGIKEEKY
uniref:TCTP domain-containing protein n=1 Tax=Mucochytrium quahogii TaxID=96639 RepID=A0A7S2RXI2_9STRA|mmetsp:Transcript_2165/g.4405  ORF Transcript_2165/g.4405 Transcript_2165/m.4405 type:complete len:175 (+) Transcript_2165:57-581(+)